MNEEGIWITPAFPKIDLCIEEDNITPDSPYYYLTEMSAKCTAKRMVPDYISEKKMKEVKEGNCFPVMGCRSALSAWKDETGKYKFYGRFNQGVVTLNLVDVALSSGGDMVKFWGDFEERLDLCLRSCAATSAEGHATDAAPILRRNFPAEKGRGDRSAAVQRISYQFSLGYAGLCECVKYMTGKVAHGSYGDAVCD